MKRDKEGESKGDSQGEAIEKSETYYSALAMILAFH